MASDQPTIPLRIGVGIATKGRPTILAETLAELGRQTRLPDEVLICPTAEADLPGEAATRALPFSTPPRIIPEPLDGTAGLSTQRNRLLDETGADVLLFLDDDFFPAPTYLAVLEAAFASNPNLVGTTGIVLADGVTGPGLTPAEGRAVLGREHSASRREGADAPVAETYGCNMAFRMATVRENGVRFDENLPLYSWQEDNDFSRRIGRHGTLLRLAGARGVHLGHKGGRTSGVRLGYSQVANFVYLVRKGSVPGPSAARHILRNIAANLLRSVRPEPWVDRRGRLRGNILALADLVRGRCDPRRIVSL